MSSIRFRFNLILLLVFLIGLGASAWYYKRQTDRLAADAVEFEARLQLQMATAVRQYTTDHVKPHFDKPGIASFAPEAVPTFAARETLTTVYKDYPGYSYREAAVNPSNPTNKANEWEMTVLQRYRTGAVQGEQLVTTEFPQGRTLHVVRPVVITEAECLRCHGDPNAAPAAMRQMYTGGGGFGWRMGETVAAQIVSVPFEVQVNRAGAAYKEFMIASLSVFVLLFVVLNVLLSRMVLRPLASANQALNRLADTDALTGVFNRRAFDHQLQQAMATARAQKHSLSIVTFDLDHFKQINDRFGHETGDEVLVHVSSVVRGNLKHRDCLARMGGEEFTIILPETSLDNARRLAELLRKQVSATPVGAAGTVTASFGVAHWDTLEPAPALLARADQALYAAKRGGRDRVEWL